MDLRECRTLPLMKHTRTILAALSAILFATGLHGQARDGSVMIDNENRNAEMIVINQPQKVAGDALQLRLERSGLKDKGKDGVFRYKGVILSEISPDKMDIYAKVEAGPNNTSIVYMAVSRGYNNFTNSGADSVIMQNVKTFLESMIKEADERSADVAISLRIDDINKDEKSYQKLLNEQSELQGKKTKIDNRLTEIQTELNSRQESLTKKKADMEDAKTRRANQGNVQ